MVHQHSCEDHMHKIKELVVDYIASNMKMDASHTRNQAAQKIHKSDVCIKFCHNWAKISEA